MGGRLLRRRLVLVVQGCDGQTACIMQQQAPTAAASPALVGATRPPPLKDSQIVVWRRRRRNGRWRPARCGTIFPSPSCRRLLLFNSRAWWWRRTAPLCCHTTSPPPSSSHNVGYEKVSEQQIIKNRLTHLLLVAVLRGCRCPPSLARLLRTSTCLTAGGGPNISTTSDVPRG